MTADIRPFPLKASRPAVFCADGPVSVRNMSEAFGMMLRAHPDAKRIPDHLFHALADVLDRAIEAAECGSERR